MDNRWWDTASGRDIERVHEAATAWKDHDPHHPQCSRGDP